MECECVYVDKLHCTLNGVCDYASSCVPPLPPAPPPSSPSAIRLQLSLSLSLSLGRLPLPPRPPPPPLTSCRGASWAIMWSHYLTPFARSRVQLTKTAPRLVMWKRFTRRTAYISHPRHPPPPPLAHPLTHPRAAPHFLPLSNQGVSSSRSPVKGKGTISLHCVCVCVFFFFSQFATLPATVAWTPL